MTEKKTFVSPSDLRKKAEVKTPPLLLHDDEGNVVGSIIAPVLWSDELFERAQNNDVLGLIRELLGDDYDKTMAAGWTIGLINERFVDHFGLTLGK